MNIVKKAKYIHIQGKLAHMINDFRFLRKELLELHVRHNYTNCNTIFYRVQLLSDNLCVNVIFGGCLVQTLKYRKLPSRLGKFQICKIASYCVNVCQFCVRVILVFRNTVEPRYIKRLDITKPSYNKVICWYHLFIFLCFLP